MSKPLRLIVLLGLVIIIGYFLQEAVFSDDAYLATIKKERIEKNQSFKSSSSPLEEAARATFDSLTYFPINRKFQVDADYEKLPNPDTIKIPMTTGNSEAYLRFAKAHFNLEGQRVVLTLFLKANAEDSTFFVPFTDRTNGTDTYEGGRFMDIPKPASGEKLITLDFNKAYNPFCVFNYNYSCPIPPAENRLPIAVPAGEKSYAKK
ncbi:DUF1684 domain-containing protein [Adhaeribacter radiodurans]|uniref:DUF1684 domain-containing protein n=1 Tax=Adhaeribacter radiodurans TaxID=2745197 RepID=A0A7L7L3E1_9BACT|nr:DUF1684 domain-containing protein [Adhaeribacter radiodurans]QMU27317.1 DUF1684 domain-containing protein [Adhaeribacter radiodurans]